MYGLRLKPASNTIFPALPDLLIIGEIYNINSPLAFHRNKFFFRPIIRLCVVCNYVNIVMPSIFALRCGSLPFCRKLERSPLLLIPCTRFA